MSFNYIDSVETAINNIGGNDIITGSFNNTLTTVNDFYEITTGYKNVVTQVSFNCPANSSLDIRVDMNVLSSGGFFTNVFEEGQTFNYTVSGVDSFILRNTPTNLIRITLVGLTGTATVTGLNYSMCN